MEILNLTNNLISHLESIVEPVKTLPKLKNLHITVKGIDEEMKLSKLLPHLKYINNYEIGLAENVINTGTDRNNFRSEENQN